MTTAELTENAPMNTDYWDDYKEVDPTPQAKTLPPDGTATMAGVSVDLLAAISLGAVFMGANTYIGNGPNFMVKTIAEGSGIKIVSVEIKHVDIDQSMIRAIARQAEAERERALAISNQEAQNVRINALAVEAAANEKAIAKNIADRSADEAISIAPS